jgi:hypothetical protein
MDLQKQRESDQLIDIINIPGMDDENPTDNDIDTGIKVGISRIGEGVSRVDENIFRDKSPKTT